MPINSVDLQPDGTRSRVIPGNDLIEVGRVMQDWGVVTHVAVEENESKTERRFMAKFGDGRWRYCIFAPTVAVCYKDSHPGETGMIAYHLRTIERCRRDIRDAEKAIGYAKHCIDEAEAKIEELRARLR